MQSAAVAKGSTLTVVLKLLHAQRVSIVLCTILICKEIVCEQYEQAAYKTLSQACKYQTDDCHIALVLRHLA
jgi:hypothetical protein